jgi:protein SCO1
VIAMIAALLFSAPLDEVGVDERLGSTLPRDLELVDEDGKRVRLGELLEGDRPVLLSVGYYGCPMLCGLVLRSVALAAQRIELRPGFDYRLITISFDPSDGPKEAKERQKSALDQLEGKISAKDWPFFTTGEPEIRQILGALGVKIKKDQRTGQYAHPAVYFVLGPNGKISRYLHGLDTSPFDVRLAIVEAGEGKVGRPLDRVLLRCFSYDPAKRKYALFVTNFLRVGGAAIFALVAGGIFILLRRERRALR